MPTLLLADDSVTIQRVVELTFANEDVRVVTTGDGESAIERIDAEPPDVVLADVGMPRLDGYAVAAHVKQTPGLRGIPVLLLTGAFEPVDEEKARTSGCDGVLVKPFEPQQLLGRVRELLAARRGAGLRAVPFQRLDPPPTWTVPLASDAPADPGSASRPDPLGRARGAGGPPLAASRTSSLVSERRERRAFERLEVDETFRREFDRLDAAFAQLDPEPSAMHADEGPGAEMEGGFGPVGADAPSADRAFGDWDLPNPPPQAGGPLAVPGPASIGAVPAWAERAADAAGRDGSARAVDPPRTPPEAPRPPASSPEGSAVAAASRLTRAGAFAALLAAEQSEGRRPTQTRVAISEALMDEIVRRALARLSDDVVQRLVLDIAERLIREELDRIRPNPR